MSSVAPVTSPDDPAAVTSATGQTATTTPVTAPPKLTTVESLEKNAPQVWNAMMIGIGMREVKEMQDSEARRKQRQREGQNT